MSVRAAIYVRVSTDDQRDNGYSIDSQLRMIKEYCEKNNYDIVDGYICRPYVDENSFKDIAILVSKKDIQVAC